MFNKASLLHLFQYLLLPKGRVQNFKGKSLKTAEQQYPTSLRGRTKADGYTTPWLKAFLSPLGVASTTTILLPPSFCNHLKNSPKSDGSDVKTAWRTLLISFTSSDFKRRGNHPLNTLQHQPNWSHACSSAKRITFVTENRQYKSAKIPEFSGRCMPATNSFLHFSLLLQPAIHRYLQPLLPAMPFRQIFFE